MLKVACKLLQWSIRLQAKFVKVFPKNFYHQRKPLLLLLSGKTHLMTQAAQQAHWQHWHRFKRLHAFHKSERNAYTLVAVIVAEQFCIMTTMAPPRDAREESMRPSSYLGWGVVRMYDLPEGSVAVLKPGNIFSASSFFSDGTIMQSWPAWKKRRDWLEGEYWIRVKRRSHNALFRYSTEPLTSHHAKQRAIFTRSINLLSKSAA